MNYQARDIEEMLDEARRIAKIGTFLPRDYARCNGIGIGKIICGRRESCFRYLDQGHNEKNYSWFIPTLIEGESGCEEYIGE